MHRHRCSMPCLCMQRARRDWAIQTPSGSSASSCNCCSDKTQPMTIALAVRTSASSGILYPNLSVPVWKQTASAAGRCAASTSKSDPAATVLRFITLNTGCREWERPLLADLSRSLYGSNRPKAGSYFATLEHLKPCLQQSSTRPNCFNSDVSAIACRPYQQSNTRH